LKISAKLGCFPGFEWGKPNFTTFGTSRMILETPLQRPLQKIFRRTGPSILSEFRFSTSFTFDKLNKETNS